MTDAVYHCPECGAIMELVVDVPLDELGIMAVFLVCHRHDLHSGPYSVTAGANESYKPIPLIERLIK